MGSPARSDINHYKTASSIMRSPGRDSYGVSIITSMIKKLSSPPRPTFKNRDIDL